MKLLSYVIVILVINLAVASPVSSVVSASDVAHRTAIALVSRAKGWNHQPGTLYCHKRPAGVCTYAWEVFGNNVKGIHFNRACIYSRDCVPLANEAFDVEEPLDGFLPEYVFRTEHLRELKGSKVYISGYERLGVFEAPVISFRGESFGGQSGCVCGETNLSVDAYWACECTFACDS